MDNPQHNPAPDPQLLISAYLDGDAVPEQLQALEQWITASEENTAEFVRRSFADQDIRTHLIAEQSAHLIYHEDDADDQAPTDTDIMSDVVDQALALRRQHEIEDEANKQLAAQQQEDARERRFELRRQAEPAPVTRVVVIPKAIAWLSLAAAVGLALWLGWPEAAPVDEDSPVAQTHVPSQPSPEVAATPAPTPVATLLHTRGAVWGEGMPQGQTSQATRVGARLLPGRYTLEVGVIELVFDQGATVIVQAPARFELLDGNAGRLSEGQLVAQVPVSAHGFRITTPTAEVIDLGTEFGVRVVDGRETEVLVFDGAVTAAQRNEAGVLKRTLRLRDGQRARVAATSLDLLSEETTFSGQRFARDWDTALRPIDVSDSVYIPYERPRALDEYGLMSEDETALVPEAMGYVLPNDLPVEVRVRGGERIVANGQRVAAEVLHAGTRVDAYLLHISRDPTSTGVTRRSGRITFDRPIVALVLDTQTLNATDAALGLPGMRYADHMPGRGMVGESPEYPDHLVLSEDGRTLTFDIAIAWYDDMRILVQSPPPDIGPEQSE